MSLAQPITTVANPVLLEQARRRPTVWWQTGTVGDEDRRIDRVFPAARQDLGPSTSSVVRWLRLVGAP
jgi:hypothetical protein